MAMNANKASDKPKEGYVKIKIPKAASGEDPTLFVGANGVGYLIERGKEVWVPPIVADILQDMDKADDELQEFLATADKT